jgi:hypothetical protein
MKRTFLTATETPGLKTANKKYLKEGDQKPLLLENFFLHNFKNFPL